LESDVKKSFVQAWTKIGVTDLAEHFPPLRGRDDGEHDLRDVESVPPVVVRHVAVVLLDGDDPTAQDGVVHMKAAGQVQVDEHAEGGLQEGRTGTS
jgi:hypothetical protein